MAKEKKLISTPFKVDPVTGQLKNAYREQFAKERAKEQKAIGKKFSTAAFGKPAKSRLNIRTQLPSRRSFI